MDNLLSLLPRTDLLKVFSPHTLDTLLCPRGSVEAYPKDATIFYPQDKVSQVRVLLSGKVHLVYFMSDGKVDLRSTLTPPSIVGLDLVCTRTQISPYQAMAADQSTSFPSRSPSCWSRACSQSRSGWLPSTNCSSPCPT